MAYLRSVTTHGNTCSRTTSSTVHQRKTFHLPSIRPNIASIATTAIASTILSGQTIHAQENTSASTIDRLQLETSIVTGRQGRTAQYFDVDDLAIHADSDISRILRALPGVHIREEDSFGLRPNIGLRGSEPDRSAKISITEDGVPIAPAPYAAPSAYYFPHPARMSAIGIITGPDSLKTGPNTLGGALAMHTFAIPQKSTTTLSASIGEFGSTRALARTGQTWKSGQGIQLGALVEALTDRSEGFKQLDTRRTSDRFASDQTTGFHIDDIMAKFAIASSPEADLQWQGRIKLHRADQTSNETYLGLTSSDFNITPLRRYAASAADRFDSKREEISADLTVSSGKFNGALLAYHTTFSRNWHKLERVNPAGSTVGSGTTGSTSTSSILANPDANAAALAIIRGQNSAPGALLIRNNNRSYYAQGAQIDLSYTTRVGSMQHSLQARARYHRDQVDRFQNYERYTMIGGIGVPFGFDPEGSESNRVGTAQAVSIFLSDRISTGALTITPALRSEWITTERLRYNNDDPTRSSDPNQTRNNSLNILLPGLSVAYAVSPELEAIVSFTRGFSPPGPGATSDTKAETASSYEAAVIWSNQTLTADARVYYSDYDNLLGTCTISSGGGCDPGEQFDGGKVSVLGLEIALGAQWQSATGITFPITLTYAHTDARFRSSFQSNLSAWGNVSTDDILPNIPTDQISLSAGAHWKNLSVDASANWVSDVRTVAGQGQIPENQKIAAHTVVDLAGAWKIKPNAKLSVRVKNLFNQTYVAARVPAGLRPGLPRQILFGLDMSI